MNTASLGLTATLMHWYTATSTLDGPDGPTTTITLDGTPYDLSPAQTEELRSVLAVSAALLRLRDTSTTPE